MGKKQVFAETMGFLGRLRRDVRGNTLAMMAAMLVPLAALSGSAVDLSRMYAVKTRLQQACDVGALAGRKMMTDTTLGALDPIATATAQQFFNNNFRGGWFKTTAVNFTPSMTADHQVSGTATATVPMTVMTMFGAGPRTVTVTCEARYDVADADIMFVLDTTGSMACTTADDPCGAAAKTYTRPDGTTGYYDQEESGSKLSGLRTAVLSFYDTLASTADPSTHIRYGFVTYTSTVNAGYLLPSSYLVSTWSYQSRHAVDDSKRGNPTSTTTVSASSATDCATHESRTPALTTSTLPNGTIVTNYTYNTDGSATRVFSTYSGNPKVCTLKTYNVSPYYRYEQVPYDVSHYVAGSSVVDPTKVTGATSKWQGCVEERDTTTGSTFNTNSLPADLDPDLAPSSDSTRWRPMWPDVIYYRTGTSSQDDVGTTTNPYGDSTETRAAKPLTNMLIANNIGGGYVSCGKPAQRLATMSRDDVSNYVNATDFKAIGGTYHDTGMIWGTRLISPTGIFASDTAAWPGRQAPNRFIVFMTDGQMAPSPQIYGMYGMEQYDQRVTGNGNSSTDLTNHNARFLAECAAAKARNITVFVVGFGSTLTSQLKTCASPGQAYYASDNASLKTAFQKIAQQVAMLRISK
jgi:Flp pilus assembly protein TadG